MSNRAWHADDGPVEVPVCRPRLPTAEQLLPWLREMDATQWYSNRGPLLRRFERELAEHFGVVADDVVVCSSATTALTVALLELETAGSVCAMPAWTFAATAHAAVQAGVTPWLLDVRDDTEALDPDDVAARLSQAPGPVGAVLVVSPFGRPVDVAAWEGFQSRTGVPVVLDAAAGFDTVRPSELITVVSLHATKALGVGEGGVILGRTVRPDSFRRRINFGFNHSREAEVGACNGKMSEYVAAVGLAALADWSRTRTEFLRVGAAYASSFEGSVVRLPAGLGTCWVSSTAVVRVPAARLTAIEDALTGAGVSSRRWWGDGLAAHRAFAGFPRTDLPVTRLLASSSLGLPCWAELPEAAVHRVVAAVLSAL
ncbi:MAG: hypothetical protein JWO88_3577 [Frankiales bacterium]|nr:hypothetical protein [Frankiales bacterium]